MGRTAAGQGHRAHQPVLAGAGSTRADRRGGGDQGRLLRRMTTRRRMRNFWLHIGRRAPTLICNQTLQEVGMEFGSIERDVFVEASPEVVFEVVSSPDHIKQWWPD